MKPSLTIVLRRSHCWTRALSTGRLSYHIHNIRRPSTPQPAGSGPAISVQPVVPFVERDHLIPHAIGSIPENCIDGADQTFRIVVRQDPGRRTGTTLHDWRRGVAARSPSCCSYSGWHRARHTSRGVRGRSFTHRTGPWPDRPPNHDLEAPARRRVRDARPIGFEPMSLDGLFRLLSNGRAD